MNTRTLLLAAASLSCVCASAAMAQDAPATAKPVAADPFPTATLQDLSPDSRLLFYGWVQAGAMFNAHRPDDGKNFGHLFDDRADEAQLNQVALTAERQLSPQKGEWDWGFKLQAMYGSDARVWHSTGLFDRYSNDPALQPDIVEAFGLVHVPVITEGGLDLKLGKFVTPLGAETVDPRSNFFYSHDYVFYFGTPFNHLGGIATLHTNEHLDLSFGVNRGINTSFDDNNGAWSLYGGVGLLNLFGGKVTSNLNTQAGPETPHDDAHWRVLNCLTTTVKITDKWTSVTDLDFCHDDGTGADAYGIASLLAYAVTDTLSVGVRGEVFSDPKGFYVAQVGNNTDYMAGLRGDPLLSTRSVGGGETTYGAITLGLNWKAPLPGFGSSLTIRPEVRYDRALNGDTKPFVGSSRRDQLTFGADAVFVF